MINVATTGIANSFAVYQTLYLQIFSDSSASAIGWIGTLLLACMLFFSLVAGPIIYYFGYRIAALGGGVFAAVGLLLAGFSKNVWQLSLTHGFLYGLGSAIPFLVSVAMVSIWFDKYRGLGMGAINGGGGLGGIILSPITQAMINKMGYQGSLKVTALIVLVLIGVSSLFMVKRIKNEPVQESKSIWKAFDKAAATDLFVFFVSFSTLFGDIAYTAPLYYLPTVVTDRGGTDSQSTLAVVLANVGSIVGSLATGFSSDRIGEMNIITICDILIAIIVPLVWRYTSTVTPILVLSFVYGFLSAAFLSIVPSILGRHYSDERAPGVISVMFVYVAVGLVIGGPLAGYFYDLSQKIGDYMPLQLMASIGFLISALILIVAQIYLRKKNPGKFGFNL
ncbi:hypothetical protein BB558_003004 [Smittium angustum]|uniref:Major facilitator superfamily (MFS) profile domain-containing protein n=1 Tax=Smittium angustum TaxID=133377 RepID=A0A2U1J782_SMIAN|nr:hypothetical protein BB558_003004 [Smittium angustum]